MGIPGFHIFRSNINNKLMGFIFYNIAILHYKWYLCKTIYIFKWISFYGYDICGIIFLKAADRVAKTAYFGCIGGYTFQCGYNIRSKLYRISNFAIKVSMVCICTKNIWDTGAHEKFESFTDTRSVQTDFVGICR